MTRLGTHASGVLERAMFRSAVAPHIRLPHDRTTLSPTRTPARSCALKSADAVGGVVHALSSAPVLRYLARLGKGWATPHRR